MASRTRTGARKRKPAKKVLAKVSRKSTAAKRPTKKSATKRMNADKRATGLRAGGPTQPSAAARIALRRRVGPPSPLVGAVAAKPSGPPAERLQLSLRISAPTPLAGALPAPSSGPALSALPSRQSVGARIIGKSTPGK